MTDATGKDKRRKSPAAHDVVRKVSAGRSGMAVTLVAAAAAFAAFADDSAWVYDTSKRVEPQVCRVASSSRALDGQSLASDASVVSTVDRKSRDFAASAETGVSSLPTGGVIIVR